jgi:hypothetical protein
LIGGRRLERFTQKDYDLLIGFLEHFDRLVTSPSILAEISNLSPDPSHDARWRPYFTVLAKQIQELDERFVLATQIVNNAHFTRLGITDAGIIECARDELLVLTDDLTLFSFLKHEQIDVINFNHLRQYLI